MSQAVNETSFHGKSKLQRTYFFVTAILIGYELNSVSRTIKPRCKVHLVRSEPCLSNPSAPGRNCPVHTLLHKLYADRESNPESLYSHIGRICC
jgi:hypothetical protein